MVKADCMWACQQKDESKKAVQDAANGMFWE